MGMSSPKTKAEAREQIAKLQGDIAHLKANLAYHKSQYGEKPQGTGHIRSEIADKKAKIAKLRAQIPSLPK